MRTLLVQTYDRNDNVNEDNESPRTERSILRLSAIGKLVWTRFLSCFITKNTQRRFLLSQWAQPSESIPPLQMLGMSLLLPDSNRQPLPRDVRVSVPLAELRSRLFLLKSV